MCNNVFVFQRTPKIVFGTGEIEKIGLLVSGYGKRCLVLRGSSSLRKSPAWDIITHSFQQHSIIFSEYEISGEPSPDMIDAIVNNHRGDLPDCIVAVGGGSVIDAGKAVSAMLQVGESVVQYLENVGTKKPDGRKVPFIAVPTTAGTGSEASANAVISQIGEHGFKRSLRHELYVPDIALVDSSLTLSCPAETTAACGMDALTQLIEAYVSPKATPFTDALIESAFPRIGKSLVNAVQNGTTDLEARVGMSYSSLVSGIALANAGLGVVHGLASLIGAHYPIPHGVVCGTLLSESIKATIATLDRVNPESVALHKYAHAGNLLLDTHTTDIRSSLKLLIDHLDFLTETLLIPKLSCFGVTTDDISLFLVENVNKNNPVQLSDDVIRQFVALRI